MDWDRFSELVSLSEAGKPDEAILGLKKLIHPSNGSEDNASILLLIGVCLREVERYADAHATLAEACCLAAKDSWIRPRALFFDAQIDIAERNWETALTKLKAITLDYSSVLRHPDQKDLREEVDRFTGFSLYETGKPAEARRLLETAATLDYDKARTLYYLGRCYYDLGDLDNASKSFVDALALELQPVFQPSAHYVLGLAYYWQGQAARAVREFEWCLANDEKCLVQKWKVLTATVNAFKALGMDKEAGRYAKMLKELN